VALLLFLVVSWVWCRVFTELLGYGTVAAQRHRSPFVFVLLTVIAAVIIIGDAAIFYVGLASQTASGWSDTPSWVIPAATLIYSCGLAAIGWWHADHKDQPRNLV
jgi:protein-S-isoprenylcysteine O-methyltransferase Ste14